MSNKEKAQQLEKEIRVIDFVIITLMFTGVVESILAIMEIVDMDIISFLIISASLFLTFVNARKRSIKELTKRVNEAIYMTEKEYYEKYPN
jgi:hypothetical protein